MYIHQETVAVLTVTLTTVWPTVSNLNSSVIAEPESGERLILLQRPNPAGDRCDESHI
jgi:hypothetical protein